MTYAVLIVDAAVPAGAVLPWAMSTRDLGFVHPGDAELAVPWVRRSGCSDVLVLARPRHAQKARTVATTVAGALPRTAAHVEILESTVLGMAVAASHALELDAPAPLAHDVTIAAVQSSVAGAVLHRVTRLDSPSPSLWQHLMSMFGRRHIVLRGALQGVRRVGSRVQAPRGATLLIAAEEGSAEFTEVVVALDFDGAAHPVPEVVPTRDTFGSAGTEFVLFVAPHLPNASWTCPVCAQSLSRAVCPFCRTTSTHQEHVA